MKKTLAIAAFVGLASCSTENELFRSHHIHHGVQTAQHRPHREIDHRHVKLPQRERPNVKPFERREKPKQNTQPVEGDNEFFDFDGVHDNEYGKIRKGVKIGAKVLGAVLDDEELYAFEGDNEFFGVDEVHDNEYGKLGTIVKVGGKVLKALLDDEELYAIEGDNEFFAADGVHDDEYSKVGDFFKKNGPTMLKVGGTVLKALLDDEELYAIEDHEYSKVGDFFKKNGPTIVKVGGTILKALLDDEELYAIEGDNEFFAVDGVHDNEYGKVGNFLKKNGPTILKTGGKILKALLDDEELYAVEGDNEFFAVDGVHDNEYGKLGTIVKVGGKVLKALLDDEELYAVEGDNEFFAAAATYDNEYSKVGDFFKKNGPTIVKVGGTILKALLDDEELYAVEDHEYSKVGDFFKKNGPTIVKVGGTILKSLLDDEELYAQDMGDHELAIAPIRFKPYPKLPIATKFEDDSLFHLDSLIQHGRKFHNGKPVAHPKKEKFLA